MSTRYVRWNGQWVEVTASSGSSIVQDGLSHHYDATAISGLSDGDAVSEWDDLSGAADLSSQGSPTLATDGIGGQPSVDYSGDGNYHTTGQSGFDNLITQPATVLIIYDPQTSSNAHVYDSAGSSDRFVFAIQTGATSDDSDAIWAGSWLESGVQTSGDTLSAGIYDGASSALRFDGSEAVTGDVGSSDWAGMNLGTRDGDSANRYGGLIGEMLIYDRRLSSSELEQTESALLDKWGIA